MSQELFQYIKKTFFPRWDRKGEWVFEELDDLNGAGGYCRSREKKIQLCNGFSSVHAEIIVIHEICHAVTSCCHGKPWLIRMEKAAIKAAQIGKIEMAASLREEIVGYQNSYQVYTAPVFYQMIRDLVVCDFRGHTERETLTAAGRETGLSYQEVLECYPRSRKVFCQAQRDDERQRKLREKLEAMLKAQ